MATVTLKNLEKSYPDKDGVPTRVVHGIDLEIKDHEFMVLVGPSGCGKSTTLRMIAGLEEITGGSLMIDGKEMNQVAPKDRDIAMVFQNYALYPHMSVYENMAFALKMRKIPKAEIDQRVREAAEQLGLTTYLDRKPKALSGGQRQRVALGRAMVRKPKVFLFDEPLSNLDARMRVSTRAELSKLHASLDATMIYVTHDQVEAMTMGDRICVMRDGRIQQVATPLELYNAPANLFVAGFIGTPPMNLLKGRFAESGGAVRFEIEDTAAALEVPEPFARGARGKAGKAGVLGIRPEDIAAGEAAIGADVRFDFKITHVETLGADTHVHAATGSHAVIARVPGARPFSRGESLRFGLPLARCHFFDAETEMSLRLPEFS